MREVFGEILENGEILEKFVFNNFLVIALFLIF